MDSAGDTRLVRVGEGILPAAGEAFTSCFPQSRAIVAADENTWRAAGEAVSSALGPLLASGSPVMLPGRPVKADMETVDRLRARLAQGDAVAIAVGSGTINDLVKLASHQLGRAYMVVATAASMDGYTAFGASITDKGSKQTFGCPAPRALLADIDVIAEAPVEMAAAGYGDLAAKVPAGADWLLADALGIEAINAKAWSIVQTPLRQWLAEPAGVRERDRSALRNLIDGLVSSGIAMQVTRNSRPASGADHQFSHLWDMEHHTHQGAAIPHGCKVAIGAIASTAMYEALMEMPLDQLDVDGCIRRWPGEAQLHAEIEALQAAGPLREKALAETRAKYTPAAALRPRLMLLRERWPELREKLAAQLIPVRQLREMLGKAGAPVYADEIGISRERMRASFGRAWSIRRRYTVLDLAWECGRFDELTDRALQAVCR